ncbi:MAG: META domain-containing protein [Chitinophagaceae bacterium]|nr:META domain-containing protein [Chitinophagaceae bacterium]
MKRTFYYSALSCLFTLCACSSVKKPNTAQAQEGGTETILTGKKWKLVELKGNPVPDKINGKEAFILLQDDDHRYSAMAGCNGLGGTFTLSGQNGIKFSQGMSTMMACENMAIETGLNQALVAADNYTIKGNVLSLSKGRMAPLARFRAMEAAPGAHVLNGTWEANYVSGARIAFDGLYPRQKPTITFDLPSGKASGNSSCNNYTIAFTLDGNNIRFADPMSTEMACEGNGEATFFKTLKTVNRYDVHGTTLNLIMGDIAVMRLEKK